MTIKRVETFKRLKDLLTSKRHLLKGIGIAPGGGGLL